MRRTELCRIVAVIALAAAQMAAGQLPPISPSDASALPPGRHAVSPGNRSDQPDIGPSNAAPETASAAPQGSQQAAPATSSRSGRVAGADRFRFRANVNLVLVEATVRDRDGSMVNDLKRENFRVFENGVEQQISYFSHDELPLAVALVLDSSGSMGPVLRQLHRVADDTLSALKPDDEVALFDFAARAELQVGLTRNRARIATAIASIHAAGGTVIPDALYEAALYLARAAPERRHAIILVSDNENTLQGYTDEKRVVRQALESEAVIYSIRVAQGSHPNSMYVILPIFREVSVPTIVHETGGEIIDARNLESIRPALATAISHLKRRYNIGYYSSNRRRDGTFREVEIRAAEGGNEWPRNFSVYARRGYYAPREDASSPDP